MIADPVAIAAGAALAADGHGDGEIGSELSGKRRPSRAVCVFLVSSAWWLARMPPRCRVVPQISGWGIDAERPATREDRRMRELFNSTPPPPMALLPDREPAGMTSASSNLSWPHCLIRAVVIST